MKRGTFGWRTALNETAEAIERLDAVSKPASPRPEPAGDAWWNAERVELLVLVVLAISLACGWLR